MVSDDSSEKSEILLQQFDTYTVQKETYDQFFSTLIEIIEGLNPDDVIDTFLHASIRNKQLREAFENGDVVKKEKLI